MLMLNDVMSLSAVGKRAWGVVRYPLGGRCVLDGDMEGCEHVVLGWRV
jgi:hypothetical protein